MGVDNVDAKRLVKTVYLIRHAQDECKADNKRDYSIRDPTLTALGRSQCGEFSASDPARTIQEKAEVILASPQRRTLSTALLALPNAVERLLPESRVILVPQLQGTSDYPCHQGLDREDLESTPEYTTELKHGSLDFSPLTPDWNKKEGAYATTDNATRARARWLRDFVRDREEKVIVVVSHGSIMRYFAARDGYYKDIDPWENVEARRYKIEWDGNVLLKIVKQKINDDLC